MDFAAPLMQQSPAAPALTVYADHGRMELSAITLTNWQAKVAHMLTALGVQPGEHIGLIAAPGWQPAVIAVGAWHVGAIITDDPDARLCITDDQAVALASQAEHIYLLSNDPFGRGVEESGGDIPFGINDFSPELRTYPDQYFNATKDGAELAPGVALPTGNNHAAGGQAVTAHHPARILTGPWADSAALAKTLLPLAFGSSVVISTDPSTPRLKELAEREHATIDPGVD